MPKISIITTTYKHKDFIAETIESVLSQTFTDWELLIGDDSPDDETWKVIQKYVEKYPDKIKAWHHSPNKGIVDNMNFLIEKSDNDSEYIAFLEGDDLFTKNNLEEKIKIFEKYKEVGMVYNNLDFIDGNSKIFETDYFKNVDKILKNEKLNIISFIEGKTFYTSYSTLIINSNILKKIGIKKLNNDKMYLTSDWDLFGKISYNYNIYGIKESLTKYRIHNSNSSGNTIKLTSDLIIGIENLIKRYNIKNNKSINYKLLHLKTYISFLKKERLKTIKYGLLSFRYSLTKNFVERIGMIIFSLLPNILSDYLYKKFKK